MILQVDPPPNCHKLPFIEAPDYLLARNVGPVKGYCSGPGQPSIPRPLNPKP